VTVRRVEPHRRERRSGALDDFSYSREGGVALSGNPGIRPR
jgi:hypothetical protein